MEYYAVLVFYAGIWFLLDCNNLYLLCVNILDNRWGVVLDYNNNFLLAMYVVLMLHMLL